MNADHIVFDHLPMGLRLGTARRTERGEVVWESKRAPIVADADGDIELEDDTPHA